MTSQSSIEQLLNEQAKAQEVAGYSSDTVIELLKKSMNIHWQQAIELTAQSVHLDRWGYKKLAAIFKTDAEQEHEHARINFERLEFFDVEYQPMTIQPRAWKRHDVKAIIEFNLVGVRAASETERATIVAARQVGDEMTAHMMIPLLQGSEDGIRLFESYLKLIEEMGLENFLTLQV